MPRSEMTREELVALLAMKATAPPPEANKLFVRHLQCKESIRLADAVRQAMDRFAGTDSVPLSTPSELLPPLGLTTLAPAFSQALPTLDTVPTDYNHEVNAELLYDLCAALVEAGLGSPETWQRCGGNAVVFAQHSIMSGIGAQRGDLLQRNVEYHLQVSDVLERDGYGSTLSNGQLAVTIECGGSGYLKIGPALDALEDQAEGLGAAFYWTLIQALYRVMRIYDHDDALMYEERLIECERGRRRESQSV